MMKTDVIEFFNRLAPEWDSGMIKDDRIIGKILDSAGVKQGSRVLDVACGTGVLFPYYLERGAKSITGIDISPAMTEIAAEKFSGDERVTILTGDAETALFDGKFDCIVIYNAFPHFPGQEKLIEHLERLLTPNGRLTVAHGMSRKKLDCHHSGTASRVSVGLMSELALAEIFSRCLDVCMVISDDEMYQVTGKKKIKKQENNT